MEKKILIQHQVIRLNNRERKNQMLLVFTMDDKILDNCIIEYPNLNTLNHNYIYYPINLN